MIKHRRYEELGPIDREVAEAAERRNEPEELSRVVIRAALHGDPNWAEAFVIRLAHHSDPIVRGNAVLCFGHLARLHRSLDLATVIPLVREALADHDADVHGHALSARDDIEIAATFALGPARFGCRREAVQSRPRRTQ